ncbi:hypothetical protein C8K38_111237 [Rhodococcus sp. OK611]|uniref:hypothetical protein n=1 Tax=unclassified Rhodococcus (in: high G+C Gram-positive bacteria) TaxID=192944 RepID=UPI000BDDA592|nr:MULTISPECIES: hypothetical protein [unclassified Rhodococcus (in: high G+C Gram-positive bacteria)]PTR42068.1 hypothetical protein C8K38_111237 [Rhodococcus sp. OK611]SNX91485.1 hypothetical protein SAMN05447004_11020 [Rhodococcus sp. OK270]
MSAPYAECDLDAIVLGVTLPILVERTVRLACDLLGVPPIELELPDARGLAPQSAGSLAPRDGTEATARGAT